MTHVRDEIEPDKARETTRSQMLGLLTTSIEFQSSLQGDSLLSGGSFLVSLSRGVKGVDVGLMMLCVMKRHDLL